MKKYREYHSQNASITVFLSLVLILILSLVMTIIEGARQTTARVFAERALTTSMDSVLAGFYGPLMEEYHLLGLDSSYGEETSEYDEIAHRMKDYMSYTLNPRVGIYGASDRLNLCTSSLESVDVINGTSLVDYGGEIFIHEVCEYMKYRTVGDVAEFFLNKVALLEQPKKISVLYEEKVKVEEKLVVIDEGILALMKYIDGVSTGRKGLIKKKDGSLKIESSFTKKILYGYPSMESTGINNEIIFLALQGQYIDPSESFSIINNSIEKIEEIIIAIESLESDLEKVQESISEANKALQQLRQALSNIKKEDEDSKASIETSIREAENSITGLEHKSEGIRIEIEDYKKDKTNYINTIYSIGNDLYDIAAGSLSASEQAIMALEQIIVTAEESEALIIAYEKSLDREKEGLDEEVFDSLREGLDELKQYQIDNKNGYDFSRMKEILTMNYEILSACLNNLSTGYQAISDQDYAGAKVAYNASSRELFSYETKDLNINYSTLVIDNNDSPDYLDGMKDLIKEGITSLVIDPKTISTDEISDKMLPSIIDMLSENDEGFSFSTLLKNMKIGGKDSSMDGLFGSFGDYSLGSLIGNGANEILERVLVQGYIDEHFCRFPVKDEEKGGRKPSALAYEQEYLIYGKTTDKANLEAVIGRLILIRTLMNFTTILGNKEKWTKAKTIASSLVGFTGLPILVAITQGVLMILLALASGLVDTCALLTGKEIPILKKRLELKYSDLLMLTRENIRRKADSIKEEKGFSYQDYITLFLYLSNQRKLSYRMMDVIQENINIRYGTDFNLQNCIFGYEAEAVFHIKPLFTTLSFMQKYITKENDKPLILRTECSY